jgi:hypothetical protein
MHPYRQTEDACQEVYQANTCPCRVSEGKHAYLRSMTQYSFVQTSTSLCFGVVGPVSGLKKYAMHFYLPQIALDAVFAYSEGE